MDEDELLEDEDEDFILVTLRAHARSQSEALTAVETFSRILVGLALDGLSVHLDVVVFEGAEEFEHDHGEAEE